MKKIILVIIAIAFFFSINLASAEVIINEVAWKGTTGGSTYEWIELANMGAPENISGWTIKDATSQLNILIPNNTIISDFYVIKRTTSNITPYDLLIAFSGGLNDAGEKLILADSNEVPKQTLDFSGGWPDEDMTSENTMQWNGSSWITALPTPKAQNATSGSSSDNNNDSGSDDDDSEEADDEKTKTIIPVLKTKILTPTLAFVGQPVEFLADIKYGASTYLTGRYFWNFGDGDSIVVIDQSGKFYHTYFYPGEYNVTLDYFYKTSFPEIPDAKTEIVIKVVPMMVSISKIGDAKDFFVELTNNADYKIDISNWTLMNGNQRFTLPKNTTIMSKKAITISGKISGFVFQDDKNLKLVMSTNEIAYDYNAMLAPAKFAVAPVKKSIVNNTVKNSTPANSENLITLDNNLEDEVPAKNLLASAILANQNLGESKSSNNFLVIILAFVLGIGGASIVYFLRRNRSGVSNRNSKGSNVGDDFSILDE